MRKWISILVFLGVLSFPYGWAQAQQAGMLGNAQASCDILEDAQHLSAEIVSGGREKYRAVMAAENSCRDAVMSRDYDDMRHVQLLEPLWTVTDPYGNIVTFWKVRLVSDESIIYVPTFEKASET